eukprot:scaffold1466_cov385-Prasinococcus_capsulatus_cf.AAC.20
MPAWGQARGIGVAHSTSGGSWPCRSRRGTHQARSRPAARYLDTAAPGPLRAAALRRCPRSAARTPCM